MGLLNPTGPTVTPQRKTEDFGEGDWTDLTPIDNVLFAFNTPSMIADSGSAYTQAASLFVPRGCDLKDGDRVPYKPGTGAGDSVDKTNVSRWYLVDGDAMFDMDQPFTNSDFGYVEYALSL